MVVGQWSLLKYRCIVRAFSVGLLLCSSLVSCGGADSVKLPGRTKEGGRILYVTLDPQKVVALDLRTGTSKVVYENPDRYDPDGSKRSVVGYIDETNEVVLNHRDLGSNAARMTAIDTDGNERQIAEFRGEWLTAVSSSEAGIGGVLSDGPYGRPTIEVKGSKGILVSIGGNVKTIIAGVQVMEAPSCTKDGTCYVATRDAGCVETQCTDIIAKIDTTGVNYLTEPRGVGPVISPDGLSLAVVVGIESGDTRYKIYDEDNGRWGAELGTNPTGPGIWSPDGKVFALLKMSPPPWWSLEVWRVDGTRVGEYQVPYRSELLIWMKPSEESE
jgi:hypothetical protein